MRTSVIFRQSMYLLIKTRLLKCCIIFIIVGRYISILTDPRVSNKIKCDVGITPKLNFGLFKQIYEV